MGRKCEILNALAQMFPFAHTHAHCEVTEERQGSALLKGVCLVILWSLCAKAL